MQPVFIRGLSVFLPNDPVDNDHIEEVLGVINDKPSRSKSRILKSNGIKTRYYALDPVTHKPTHSNAQMTALAIKGLAERTGLDINEIQCLVSGTSSPDQIQPNHALMVHGELGCPPCEVVCTSGVCCSGMAALKYGYMNVALGLVNRAVTTGSELVSNQLRAIFFQPEIDAKLKELESKPFIAFEKDFLRWMLSDAAAAVLVADTPNPEGLSLKIEWIEYISYANELPACMYAGAVKNPDGSLKGIRDVDDPDEMWKDSYIALKQDAKLLGDNIIRYGQKGLLVAKDKHNLKSEDIDWFLPHYSSEFFRSQLYDYMAEIGLVIPYEKWFTNLTYKGNTGSASIFVILEELLNSGRIKKGDKVFCLVPESARFSYAYMLLTAV
jgi:3-oxoacyl-[acyl-carrier-protein] synthase-3